MKTLIATVLTATILSVVQAGPLKVGNLRIYPDHVDRISEVTDDGKSLRVHMKAKLGRDLIHYKYTVTIPHDHLREAVYDGKKTASLITRDQIRLGSGKWSRKKRKAVPVVHRWVNEGETINRDLLQLNPGVDQKVISLQCDAEGGRWILIHVRQTPKTEKKENSNKPKPIVSVMMLEPYVRGKITSGESAVNVVGATIGVALKALFVPR